MFFSAAFSAHALQILKLLFTNRPPMGNQTCCTSARALFKDTLMKKSDSNQGPRDHEACALPHVLLQPLILPSFVVIVAFAGIFVVAGLVIEWTLTLE